ncbi:uncharacterized protein PG986_008078 [Apiospora aurea]|uniref:Protein kinase domain-containing protein n=1 Tax=Apiospora aurea TaxID=335848 RepID=A0ABR1QFU0_9PEZI
MSSFSETIDDMITSSGGSSIDPNNATDRLQEVKKYFTNEGLQFRKVIAQGNHGGAVLFDQWLPVEPTPGPEAGSIIKYALDTQEDATSDNDADLRNEFGWLRRFRGAEHIIQVLPEYNHLWRTDNNDNNQSSGDVETGPVLSHPVIVMEYLENGTLEQLINRFGRIERRIPQRLLWSFALCLLRAVAAISYPAQLDGRRRRETARDEPPGLITQNSWKAPNVLVGDMWEEGDAEHSLAPVLKLIDFGRGREEDPAADEDWKELYGLSKNMAGVGWVIFPFPFPNAFPHPGYRHCIHAIHRTLLPKTTPSADTATSPKTNRSSKTSPTPPTAATSTASAVFDPYDFYTDVHAHVLENERLDKALRDLIAMCRAGQRHELPTLREFLTLGRAGRRKTAEEFRHLYDQKKEEKKEEEEDGGQTEGQAEGQGRNQEQSQGQGGTETMDGEEWLCETDEVHGVQWGYCLAHDGFNKS